MIRSIELIDFLAHSNTKLEFDSGATVFVGDNGAGKSSIIDAIIFSLFGESRFGKKNKKGLIRRGANQGYAKIEEDLDTSISKILEKISTFDKKPVVEIKIIGNDIERDVVQTKIFQIIPQTLHCSWKMLQSEDSSSVLLNRPARIDEELFKLAVNALKSEKLANFAVNDLLPLLSSNQLDQATQLVIENFEQFKERKNDS